MTRASRRIPTLLLAALCACRGNTPGIAIDAESADFGPVEVGSGARRFVTLSNLGSGAAALRDLRVVGGDGQFTVETEFSEVDLPTSASVSLALAFRPLAEGEHSATLTLSAGEDRREVALRGVGIANRAAGPRVSVVPATVEFGDAAPGAERRVYVSNVGRAPLRLQSRPALSGADAAAFELETPTDFEVGSTLAPGATSELIVRVATAVLGTRQATLQLGVDDPAQPATEIAVGANVVRGPTCGWHVTPSSVWFRSPDLSPVTHSFQLWADSATSEWCIVRNLRLAPDSAPAFTLRDGPIAWASVRRGEALAFEVQFAPTAAGYSKGAVQFEVDGAATPRGTLPLEGEAGPEGCLMIAPNDLDFGAVPLFCASRERTFTIYNVCRTSVTVESIAVEPRLSAFEVTQLPALPTTLASGEQLEFKARFRPGEIAEHSAKVLIRAAGLTYVVRVSGRGAPSFRTDVWHQSPRSPKIDMLYVIDESPSMADKHQAIANNVGSLIDIWDRWCVDYQIAVTTTSLDSAHGGAGSGASIANGRFLPLDASRPRIVTPSTPNHRQVALQNAAVGTSGTTPEYLFRPAVLAMSPPLSTGENAGFVRADGNLLYVAVISDSADRDTAPVSDYATFLASLKPGPAQSVMVDAIVPTGAQPRPGCSYGEPDAGLSTRMTDLAAMTRGDAIDVCESGWFGWGVLETYCPRTRIWLAEVPDPQLLRVDVDGQPYPAVGPNREVRWTYSPDNAIDFVPEYTPPNGSRVTITYAVACPQ